MEQAESKAKLVEEKRTKASRETYDESVASVHGGRKRRSLLVGARDDLRSSKDDAGGDVANLADLVDILEEHELSDEGDEGEGRGEALPVPTVSGEFDALEPVLLLPGAHFGEQAFFTEMRPHTCSVRTDDH
ncbi:hypothetical protein Ctob_013562 [Chrysochromulina tobinii]|uniref:Uncharacterized protein n=1 Tax=Chrysochromulina tobinii TaxID=1460289 RepID=A0A0M0LQP6_9EUKA|nr:hypothetical protein Ctob_013562 [Chrysochromulina tobinii]|eukprot:KOO53364.1 hypothetical protein Ctob_013562 [Chrysochromulina sp. CCMP291]